MIFTELPPDSKYQGLTRLAYQGRTFVCIGVGPKVRKALEEKARAAVDRA